MSFPKNAKADFRGIPSKTFAMVSSPQFQLNIRFDEALFRLGNTIVNGTFMSEAYIMCGDARFAHSATNATTLNYGWHAAWLECEGKKRWCYPHSEHACANMSIRVNYATSIVRCGSWKVETRVRRVYNSIGGTPRRIDFQVEGSDASHGILGQNLRNPRNGSRDSYTSNARYMLTKAQAEGAIDGVYTDYIESPFSAKSRFSLFHGSAASLSPVQGYAE
tara:strand:+ start:215 stop:874 length:660 start_codon:yes stop_codon:yes gene_type:complete